MSGLGAVYPGTGKRKKPELTFQEPSERYSDSRPGTAASDSRPGSRGGGDRWTRPSSGGSGGSGSGGFSRPGSSGSSAPGSRPGTSERSASGRRSGGAKRRPRGGPRPKTEHGRRSRESAEELVAHQRAAERRPNTPVFDDNFQRARAILRERARTHKRMRAPGARPAGDGIQLEMSMLPRLGKLYINQYIHASIAMLKRYEEDQREARQRHANNLKGSADARDPDTGRELDVFERADLDVFHREPLMSQLVKAKGLAPIPKAVAPSGAGQSNVEVRKSQGAENVLRGRLGALARLARDDAVLCQIKFCHESIDDDWCASTAQAMKFNTHLDTLVLVGNGITDASGVQVANAVAHHPACASVALGGNALGDDTARAFADALRESATLLSLNLAANKFHYDHYRDKARRKRGGLGALAYLRKLKREREAASRPNTARVEALHDAIETVDAYDAGIEKTYEGLDGFNPVGWGAPSDDPLYNPKSATIGHRGCAQLAHALAGTKLTSLDLSGQSVEDAGAKALARALHGDYEHRCAAALKYLSLDGNGVGDDGAIALIDVWTNVFCPLLALRLAMNRCTDAAAMKLSANVARYGPRVLKGRKTLQFVDLSLNHVGQAGCYAVEATAKKLGYDALYSVFGNPGFSGARDAARATTPDPFAAPGHARSEEEVYHEAMVKLGRNLRPIRSGGTGQTDSKTNLLNLRVPTPFLSPRARAALSPRSQYDLAHGSESYLRTTSRAAAAREKRRQQTFTPLHQRKKQLQREETGRIKYAPDPCLPPLSFQKDARNLNRFNRRRRLARIENEKRNEELREVKAKLMKSISSQRLREAIAGKEHDSDEEREQRPGAKATRAVGDLYKYFPKVLDIDGAPYGRIDLSKDGPRFSARRKEGAARPANMLKAAAKSTFSMRAMFNQD